MPVARIAFAAALLALAALATPAQADVVDDLGEDFPGEMTPRFFVVTINPGSIEVCLGPDDGPRLHIEIEDGVLVWFPVPPGNEAWVAGAAEECP